MKVTDMRRYEMLVRVRDFGAAHTDLFPPDSLSGRMFAAVHAAVATLSDHAVSRLSSLGAARGAAATKAAAFGVLHSAIEAIHATARALAGDTPGVSGKFRLPSGQAEQTLLATGRAYARDAEPFASAFIAHGLSATFLADLTKAVATLETAIRDHRASRDADVAARTSFDAALQAGMNAVARLDALVRNRLHDDPATRAVWERVRRVERVPRSREGTAKPTPEPPTPTTTPPTVTGPSTVA